jgi:hypothetical protein
MRGLPQADDGNIQNTTYNIEQEEALPTESGCVIRPNDI